MIIFLVACLSSDLKRNLNRFLAKQHLKKDFLQRFLAKQPPKKSTEHTENTDSR